MFKSLFSVLLLLISTVESQGQTAPASKLSPRLKQNISTFRNDAFEEFQLVVSDRKAFLNYLEEQHIKNQIVNEYPGSHILVIRLYWSDVMQKISNSDPVEFIEQKRTPKEELQINGFDLSTNHINVVHSEFPQLNGAGLTVNVKENKPDTTDIDLKGRFLFTPFESTVTSSHASIMSTMIAGAGNSWFNSLGVAPAALITSADFINLIPEPDSYYQQYNISVQNHSYGTGIENYYGADAAAYDQSMINNPSLLHVFSSGNSGGLTGSTGPYASIPNLANLTGSFKMAKNIITVGATDSLSKVAAASSKGPAYDGRIKPEMVAFGIDGSSGAAAIVSGTALLLQQQYKGANNTLPENALIKAILLNSADDAGTAGPDYSNGYGSLNAIKAVTTLQKHQYFAGNIVNNATQSFDINLPAGTKNFKVTLVWNDPPAAANSTKALINDLDISLKNISTSETWQPWVLSKFPQTDSLQKPAVRKKDDLNNVEQITVDDPAAGNYKIIVTGFSVTTATQKFFIVYQIDSAQQFKWLYPTTTDFIFPGQQNKIRWESTFAANTGKLEYSIDNGIGWQLISNATDLSTKYYNWAPPDTTAIGLLRMSIGSDQFVSDRFPISKRTNLGVGFNCSDSFLLFWNKLPGITNYNVYNLSDRYLQLFKTTYDSFLIINKSNQPSFYYAVAPIINNKEGVKSYSVNYTLQGVDCYFRSLLSSLNNNIGTLDLSLGSLYNINKIVLQKLINGQFQPIQTLNTFNGLTYTFNDSNLTKGLNVYRIQLQTTNGFIYSDAETIYYFTGQNYIAYPNPVSQNSSVNIAVNVIGTAVLDVYNATGAKISQLQLDNRVNKIPANKLSKGMYFLRIHNNGVNEQLIKLVVL